MKKVFKTFLKMKYNHLSLFIYKKEFRPEHHHSATAHSLQHQRRTAASAPSPERTTPTGAKKKRKYQGRKNKKREENSRNIKLQHFEK